GRLVDCPPGVAERSRRPHQSGTFARWPSAPGKPAAISCQAKTIQDVKRRSAPWHNCCARILRRELVKRRRRMCPILGCDDVVVIGQMLGPYQVLSKLGEGGMG